MSDIQTSLDHAKASYTNSQEVIRFVDSKTGIMTGVVTITTALPIAVFHFFLSGGKSDEAATILKWLANGGTAWWLVVVSVVGLLIGFAAGVVSLVAATSGLMARRPRTIAFADDSLLREITCALLRLFTLGRKGRPPKSEEVPVTCLFPLYKPEQREQAIKRFKELEAGKFSIHDVLHEYAAQLTSVGSILETKISRNRTTVRYFETQVAAYAVSTACCAILIMFFLPQPITEPWDPTAPGHAQYCSSLPEAVS